MGEVEDLKKIFRWTQEDQERAERLLQVALKHAEDLLLNLPYDFSDRKKVELWLEGLFSLKRNSDPTYGDPLVLSSLRHFLQEKIEEENLPPQESQSLSNSLNKILDIHLLSALPNRSVETGLFSLSRYQRGMIKSIVRVSRVFDVFILLTLLLVGFSIVVWILYEFYMVLVGKLPLEKGGLSILGSVLILYAISELLLEQTKHIRGGHLSIKAFVGVALAAVIRKVLIISLSPEKFYELITLSLVLLALGVVFLLIHKVESSS